MHVVAELFNIQTCVADAADGNSRSRGRGRLLAHAKRAALIILCRRRGCSCHLINLVGGRSEGGDVPMSTQVLLLLLNRGPGHDTVLLCYR